MPEDFKWTPKVISWLIFIIIICSVISYNLPEHPKPNETVFLPGYQFIEYAIYIIGIAGAMAAIRKRRIILDFKVNWLEAFIALTGVAFFISPFTALFAKFLLQVFIIE